MRPLFQSPTSPPWFRHLTHDLSEPDQFADAVSGAELRADFLRRPEGVTRVEQFQSKDWALDFYDARVHARLLGAPPPGWGSIALMRNEVPSRWYGRKARRGLLVFTPPGEAIDGCVVPGFLGIAVHLPPAVWERSRQSASIEDHQWPGKVGRLGTVRLLPGPTFDHVEARLLALRKCLLSDSAVTRNARIPVAANRLVADLMTLAWNCLAPEGRTDPDRDRQGPRNRVRLARKAEEWLRDHLHERVTIPDLCLAMRVSRRELEYAFRLAFDQSPRDFLQALRLNAIRRALLHSPVERGIVTEVALEHGVTHLGRFAGHYRDLFGELPGSSSIGQGRGRRPLR